MTFPDNDLERVLQAAATEQTGAASFIQTLFEGTALFPMNLAEDGSGSLPVITIDNRAYIPLFTSAEQAGKGAPDTQLVESPVAEFMKEVPVHLGIAVNPSGDLGLPLSAETVQHQLGRSTTISLGTRVRMGEPAEEPVELLQRIGIALGTVAAVREARRVWAQVGETAPGLVIGLDLDPDNPDTRESAVNAVSSAIDRSVIPFPVDVVFTSDRDDFTQWMSAHATPFYVGA